MASSKITRLTRDDVIEGLRDIVLRLQKDGTAVGVYIVREEPLLPSGTTPIARRPATSTR